MIHTLELDKQTASFVRQLEEQRRIEKNLMVERVRGTKEGLESVFHDIRERVEALERMTSSVSTSYIAPIGWSQLIFAGTDGNSNTIMSGDRDDTLCKHDRVRYLEDASYLRLSANPHYVERVLPNKSAHARAAANPSTWDNLGYVHVGYSTSLRPSCVTGTDDGVDPVAPEYALQLGGGQRRRRGLACACRRDRPPVGDL